MTEEPSYDWIVLQEGTLALQSDGSWRRELPHVCTSVLLWPEGQNPAPENTLIVDPCFTEAGLRDAQRRLATIPTSLRAVGRYFETHAHWDHRLDVPAAGVTDAWQRFRPGEPSSLPGVAAVPCPGHERDLHALVFPSDHGQVWAVGDAILGEAWLRAWQYYWPNGYLVHEIVDTWQSVAKILIAANEVVPGHGPPFRVTAPLLRDIMANFRSAAEYADRCPDVYDALAARLATF